MIIKNKNIKNFKFYKFFVYHFKKNLNTNET